MITLLGFLGHVLGALLIIWLMLDGVREAGSISALDAIVGVLFATAGYALGWIAVLLFGAAYVVEVRMGIDVTERLENITLWERKE